MTVVRATVRAIRAVDVVVGVSLLAWWVLSPAFYDDGWTIARQRGFATSRGFSYLLQRPWHEPPQRLLARLAPALVHAELRHILVLRIPTLLCLAVVWALCRWTLSRVTQDETSTRGLPEWVLAAAFLTGAMAWGMTLRPEPIIAVLVTGTLLCAVWFSEGGGPRPFGAPGSARAVRDYRASRWRCGARIRSSSSPVRSLRWARTEFATAVAIVTSAFALLVTLAFVGSDIGQRADDAQATRIYGGVTDTWRDEAARYDYLSVTVVCEPRETRVGCRHGTRRSRIRPAATTRPSIARSRVGVAWHRTCCAHCDPEQVALALRRARGHRRAWQWRRRPSDSGGTQPTHTAGAPDLSS